jgi:hypothetical protein
VICGTGYYAKTIFMPLGACMTLVSFLYLPRKRIMSILPILAFACVVTPLFYGWYAKFHRLAPAEVGKMNYVQTISDTYLDHYDLSPELVHKPKLLYKNPNVYEFSESPGGTYPVWYDREYWFQGARFQFSLLATVVTAVMNV